VASFAVLSLLASAGLSARGAPSGETYRKEPMPPGFHVEQTELDGPVFADATGHTIYRWPLKDLRNGDAGERKGQPSCTNEKHTESTGLQSPYPGGYTLPDLDTRPSCAKLWPPVLAPAGAKAVGKWTIVDRPDGQKQWAYDGYALYTSVLDQRAGDVLGGTARSVKADSSAVREPVGPPLALPPQFRVYVVATGRLLVLNTGYSVYTSDRDGPNKSKCDAVCAQEWSPVLAPAYVQAEGDLGVITTSPGVHQWTFRKKPLYTHISDSRFHSLEGSDVPGWHNVYTSVAPKPPGFTVQDTRSGQVLADTHGRTVYVYFCGDDSIDQFACDHPSSSQAYRFAISGGGIPERALKTWPYVVADKNARTTSRSWSIIEINPQTGHKAVAGEAGALRVWAFRDRPVFTFSGDSKPGDVEGDGWGEFNGWRDGFKAFWLRDDYGENAS